MPLHLKCWMVSAPPNRPLLKDPGVWGGLIRAPVDRPILLGSPFKVLG